jgi:DnaJ-class molecular chaperone
MIRKTCHVCKGTGKYGNVTCKICNGTRHLDYPETMNDFIKMH